MVDNDKVLTTFAYQRGFARALSPRHPRLPLKVFDHPEAFLCHTVYYNPLLHDSFSRKALRYQLRKLISDHQSPSSTDTAAIVPNDILWLLTPSTDAMIIDQ